MKLHEKLKAYRKRKGITLVHIAKKCGRPVSTLYALENGFIRLKADDFVELCKSGYDVDPSEIIEGEESEVGT